jgi:hypothetical protein
VPVTTLANRYRISGNSPRARGGTLANLATFDSCQLATFVKIRGFCFILDYCQNVGNLRLLPTWQ